MHIVVSVKERITSAEEVCVCVSVSAKYHKKFWTDFGEILWRSGEKRSREESRNRSDFGGNPDSRVFRGCWIIFQILLSLADMAKTDTLQCISASDEWIFMKFFGGAGRRPLKLTARYKAKARHCKAKALDGWQGQWQGRRLQGQDQKERTWASRARPKEFGIHEAATPIGSRLD